MATFTEEQIAQLAPDASSLKSGRELANEKKWRSLQFNDGVIWGAVQGSGSQPYLTQVDQSSLGYNCTCPSRKFPCKHALGILFLFVRRQDLFQQSASEPEWVEKWMNTREEKVEKAKVTRLHPAIKDVKSKAKREAVRMDLVKAGAAELELLLRDLLRSGLLNLPNLGNGFFEQAAARMVDQQANGLALLMRQFTKINYTSGNAWHAEAMEQMIQIWQLLQAFQHLDDLPELLQEDVRSLIGWTPKQEELLADEQALNQEDNWLVLAEQSSLENQITILRFYLWGCKTGTSALLLDFVAPGTAPKYTFVPGMILEATTLVFFPSVRPFRALIKASDKTSNQLPVALPSLPDWRAAQQALVNDLTQYPWADQFLSMIDSLQLIHHEGNWYLGDAQAAIMPLHVEFSTDQCWQLYALTGGHTSTMAVLRKRDTVLPLGLIANGIYQSI